MSLFVLKCSTPICLSGECVIYKICLGDPIIVVRSVKRVTVLNTTHVIDLLVLSPCAVYVILTNLVRIAAATAVIRTIGHLGAVVIGLPVDTINLDQGRLAHIEPPRVVFVYQSLQIMTRCNTPLVTS